MKSIISLLAMTISLNVFSHEIYVGKAKNSNTNCSLEIKNAYYDGEETKNNLKVEVAVSLIDGHAHGNHDHAEEFNFTIQPGTLANMFSGTGSNGQDKINVGSSSIEEFIPNMFAIKWLHGNHFHNLQCLNLQLVDHAHE